MNSLPESTLIARFDSIIARPGLPQHALRRLARFASIKLNSAPLGHELQQWAERAIDLASLQHPDIAALDPF